MKMAELGVEAIAKFKATGEKPEVTPGLDFYDTGVALVTDKPVEGVRASLSLKVRSCAGARTELNDEAAGSTPHRAKVGSAAGRSQPVRGGDGASPREIPEYLLQQGSPHEP